MELLLLLLVIFLQLGEGVGGGRQGWVWVTSGGRLLAPKQPQPYGNWALGGRSGVLLGQWDRWPHREMSSLRGSLSNVCTRKERRRKKRAAPCSTSFFHLSALPASW